MARRMRVYRIKTTTTSLLLLLLVVVLLKLARLTCSLAVPGLRPARRQQWNSNDDGSKRARKQRWQRWSLLDARRSEADASSPPSVAPPGTTSDQQVLCNDDDDDDDEDPFVLAMQQLNYSQVHQQTILNELKNAGLWDDGSADNHNSDSNRHHDRSHLLRTLTAGWIGGGDGEGVSSVLRRDFGLPALQAHQIRAALQRLHAQETEGRRSDRPNSDGSSSSSAVQQSSGGSLNQQTAAAAAASMNDPLFASSPPPPATTTLTADGTATPPRGHYRELVVNRTARRRAAGVDASYEYGLPSAAVVLRAEFPLAAAELDSFWTHMTVPTVTNTAQSEPPLRPATARVYLHHARLFLGWYWNYRMPELESMEQGRSESGSSITDDDDSNDYSSSDKGNLSIYKIFPTREKDSVGPILLFLQWLRSTRHISISYEANLLRGLGKLLKFRFCQETRDGGGGGDGDDADLPVLRELRRWHNEANRRQSGAPRVADEGRKWLTWPEYLTVVRQARDELHAAVAEEQERGGGTDPQGRRSNQEVHPNVKDDDDDDDDYETVGTSRRNITTRQRNIASLFQKYLVLAFFACIPDRQRTMRELEIGRSFLKNEQGQYVIKHNPDDYKTGKTYGERPPLVLPSTLTAEIDEFIQEWRPCLGPLKKNINASKQQPQYRHLFLQVRTGRPLTSNSVYQIVSATCYRYSGKRTNPHLLRDMIVTHVREAGDASEQQLEALALFMAHSVNVQKKSYDRRTLTKKVEPAVALMDQVNQNSGGLGVSSFASSN